MRTAVTVLTDTHAEPILLVQLAGLLLANFCKSWLKRVSLALPCASVEQHLAEPVQIRTCRKQSAAGLRMPAGTAIRLLKYADQDLYEPVQTAFHALAATDSGTAALGFI